MDPVYVHREPLPIDQSILGSMRIVDFVGYAPNTNKTLRNQVPYLLTDYERGMVSLPVGENAANMAPKGAIKPGTEPNQPRRSESPSNTEESIPKLFRRVFVKHAKMASDEFNYEIFNQTCFSGLESNALNSYCNALLVLLFHIAPFRSKVTSHLCRREFCLTCELSFLFDNLSKASGTQPCTASNFIRAFRTIPEANALGLLLGRDDHQTPDQLSGKIQSFNRFLLQQVSGELKPSSSDHSATMTDAERMAAEQGVDIAEGMTPDDSGVSLSTPTAPSPDDDFMTEVFGCEVASESRCLRCSSTSAQAHRWMSLDLSYGGVGDAPMQFSDLLERKLCNEDQTSSWCSQCKKFISAMHRKTVSKLPRVLALNCHIESDMCRRFWATQHQLCKREMKSTTPRTSGERKPRPCKYGDNCRIPNCHFHHDAQDAAEANVERTVKQWIPFGFRTQTSDSQLKISEDDDGGGDTTSPETEYRLVGAVYLVETQTDTGGHLVTCVRRPEDDLTGDSVAEPNKQWILYNGISAAYIEDAEVIDCESLEWKIPCILYYQRADVNSTFIPPSSDDRPITWSILMENDFIISSSTQRRAISSVCVPLKEDETLGQGDMVAIDAEFVTVSNKDHGEIPEKRSGGVGKGSPNLAVARVTCVRGTGPMEGTPFLDDYIATHDDVSDYLTEVSGIKPGDLDRSRSLKHLTSLKSIYLKLRVLADEGVTFVGHGLRNDFRVINLVVPSEQICDTVYLFHKKQNRMISLRFLAWHYLALKIQSETHDSVEDARTALKLYRKYRGIASRGNEYLERSLAELYGVGENLQWKLPEE